MQGSRAWLRLRRAWGVVSTGLCGRINQQLRRLQRGESQTEGSVSELRCWGSWGSACSHGKSSVPWILCPGKALQGWLRSGKGKDSALLGRVTS